MEKAAVAFVLHFSSSCTNQNNSDDLLMVLQQFVQNLTTNSHADELLVGKVEEDFFSDLYRALNLTLDHSMDSSSDKLLRNPTIQRCLSLQASLDYKGEGQYRTTRSKVAWTLLNLRMISLTVAFAFTKPPRGGDSEISKPGIWIFQMHVGRVVDCR